MKARCAIAALSALWSAAARADAGELATARYEDERVRTFVASSGVKASTRALLDGEGQATTADVGYTARDITFKAPTDLLIEQLGTKRRITEHSGRVSLDQGLAVGRTLGLLGGASVSPLSRTRYYGARIGWWFREETLQTSFDVRRTVASQVSVDFTDTDGVHVVTPADLEGLNAALTVTHFTTPSTILRASGSRTERSDRPAAWSASLEGRQFIAPADAALHVAVSHYENIGTIKPITQYGQVVANSARGEWHQRVGERWIASAGYRWYIEIENPRPELADRKRLGSDTIHVAARWRFGAGAWTADVSEVNAFVARYTTNEPSVGSIIGLGAKVTVE